ncbi:2-oxoglutarate and iron-dependent oxygenase domain-containing protein [Pigmentiphaga soli]|uniref:2-oxoglutarate-dependent ethylene/succinate-forming enzyme n=1 Tax=Pigmentiphaga soli TaxID=1007095 RepID=A0ABP8GPK8_9BURK
MSPSALGRTERPSTLHLAADEIPVLDLGPYLAGEPGAIDAVARDLLYASTNVGFYYLKNHGIPQSMIDRVFAESERFHRLPEEEKQKLKIDKNKIGYFGAESTVTRHSELGKGTKPNLYSAFCVRNDLAADDPDVLAGKLFRGLNQWPGNLPGFRENVMAYSNALENLGRRLLPIFSRALNLPPDFFDAAFRKPLLNMQLNYYAHQPDFDGSQYGLAPHTDRTFITILCQAKVPGLEIRTADGRWVVAPALPGHFLVNTGDLLRLWTNELFLSTPHRVINTSQVERHSIPFFFNPDPDTVIECLPTCQSAERPAKNPPVTYSDYYEWFVRQNYPDVVTAMAAHRPAASASS